MEIVISVGGSLINPGSIDVNFIKHFKALIEEKITEGDRFAIVAGGGKIARDYQEAGSALADLSDEELDWIGIYATIMNANFLKVIFQDLAHPEIIINPTKDFDFKEKVIIGSGWKPGCSTDFDTVLIAKKLGAKKLINLSNIDYAYDKDPRKNKDAKPIKETTWAEFRKILPEKWDPGLSAPFDPVAAKEAESLGIEVAIMNGSDIGNLKNYLEGKDFKGTVVR